MSPLISQIGKFPTDGKSFDEWRLTPFNENERQTRETELYRNGWFGSGPNPYSKSELIRIDDASWRLPTTDEFTRKEHWAIMMRAESARAKNVL